jgi:hypothetical protein
MSSTTEATTTSDDMQDATICSICGYPLEHEPKLGEYIAHPKCALALQVRVEEGVQRYRRLHDGRIEQLQALADEATDALITIARFQDGLLYEAVDLLRSLPLSMRGAWGRDVRTFIEKFGKRDVAFAEDEVLAGKVARMQPVIDAALTLCRVRGALDAAARANKSQDFMGQLRERQGLAGRELDKAVALYEVADKIVGDYVEGTR